MKTKEQRISEEDARIITLVRLAETDSAYDTVLPQAERERATERAVNKAGSDASLARFVQIRAAILWRTLRERSRRLELLSRGGSGKALGMILACAAFVLGALSNQFMGGDARINLIAPPLIGLLVWNLAIYLILALRTLANLVTHKEHLLLGRRLFAGLTSGIALQRLVPGAFSRRFASEWIPAVEPLACARVGEALHMAAVFFAAGLITSMAVRGWSQAWTAGWESTWLNDNPGWVAAAGQMLYGWIPSTLLGLPALPDAAGWASLRFDHLTATGNAAPWMVRIMLAVAAIVIVPRLLLAAGSHWKASRIASDFPLDLSDAYYTDLSKKRQKRAAAIDIVCCGAPLSEAARRILSGAIHAVCRGGESVRCIASPQEMERLEKPSGDWYVLLWIPLASTPEPDVHGVLVQNLRLACADARITGLIDTGSWAERFAAYPERIRTRQDSWKEFLDRYGINAVSSGFEHLGKSEAETLLQELL